MGETVCNPYGLTGTNGDEVNALCEEPVFYEGETTLVTGASAHTADSVDFPGHDVTESQGSRPGQLSGCAGGKLLRNQ